ncbi:cysteine-rich RLK (receptor-like protein kinase) 8, partial [Trifolium medium]|nr:cysteine-rich RLK (receptor-like protein kinase) 8 [Trifolium medium]
DNVDDEEVSLLSRRINQLWKHRQRRLKTFNKSGGRVDSASGQRKSKIDKDVICYECQEPSHYRNECPKLSDEKPKNKLSKKKVLIATWDDSDSDAEEGNIALMADIEAISTDSESDSEQ